MIRRVIRTWLHALGDRAYPHGALVDRGSRRELVADLEDLARDLADALNERDAAQARVKEIEAELANVIHIDSVVPHFEPSCVPMREAP